MGFGRNSEAHQDARPLQVTVAVRYRMPQLFASSSPGLAPHMLTPLLPPPKQADPCALVPGCGREAEQQEGIDRLAEPCTSQHQAGEAGLARSLGREAEQKEGIDRLAEPCPSQQQADEAVFAGGEAENTTYSC
jgi:hypothetical protein